MGRVDHDLSDAQWTALTAAWGGCAYCGASKTLLRHLEINAALALQFQGPDAQ